MEIKFTKMHGIGNDYIYVNCLDGELENPSAISMAMSPRHFAVGADGLVMICKSDVADAKMRMFNADGSEGKMCGNAIRCVGKYLYDNRLTDKTELKIETLSGIKILTLTVENQKVKSVSVYMGKAAFEPSQIPVKADSEMVNQPITVEGKEVNITAVSMGNPHSVIYTEGIDFLDLEKIGPSYENHPIFPDRVNTEFVEIIDRQTLKMRVWERGSGETMACGTGACAVVAASVKNGICDADVPVTVKLRGGDLTITCTSDYEITMNGTATKAYEGVYEYEL